MATVTITSPVAGGTALTTELNTLSGTTTSLFTVPSAAITTTLHLFADFTFTSGSGGAILPVAGGYMALYIIPGGPTASYPVANTATVGPGESYLAAILPLPAISSVSHVAHAYNVPVPPYDFKVVIGNYSGVNLFSSGNTLAYKWHDLTVA